MKPETLIGWQRRVFHLFWRWKSRGGRPRLPKNFRPLIAQMVRENPAWGQVRVAAELSLKLGVSVSPRTVRNYWPENLQPNLGPSGQRWATASLPKPLSRVLSPRSLEAGATDKQSERPWH